MGEFRAAKGCLSAHEDQFYFNVLKICRYTSVIDFYKDLGSWTKDGLASLEKCRHKKIPVVLGGGGGALFDQFFQVPLIKRSDVAPSNPGKWTIPTGRFETDDELISPSLMIRELWEEINLYRNGSVVDPQDIIYKMSCAGKATSYPLDHMIISYGEMESHFYGWLCLSPEGELNAIIPVMIKDNLLEYKLLDGEKGEDGNLLRRQIALYHAKKVKMHADFCVTAHAKVALDRIAEIF